jgi:hypothetical protein
MEKMNLEFLVTLWPSFPHFSKFAQDNRLSGIRLNSAMMSSYDLDKEFQIVKSLENPIPLYFDIKGRQLRVKESFPYKDHLEVLLNHPIEVKTPTVVLFKAGEDSALLEKVEGNRLIFKGGPDYMVYPGESLHIRDPNLIVKGPTFLPAEIEKIEKAKKAGFNKWFLSYTESQADVEEFRNIVGPNSEIILKIENMRGLDYVANTFKKQEGLSLMAARGDLYVEIDKPHEMMDALKLISSKDPGAYVGSRILLSLIRKPVPECSDLLDMAWLYDNGYSKMMLCDDLCLKDEWLSPAINVLESFRDSYTKKGGIFYPDRTRGSY